MMNAAGMIGQRMVGQQQMKVRRIWRRRPDQGFPCRQGKVAVSLVILLLVLGANIILQAYVAKARYDLTKYDRAIAELERKINIQAMEIADLSSERSIEQAAEERFGMRRPKAHEIAYMPVLEEIETPKAEDETANAKLVLASIRPQPRPGLSERFVAWLQGIGRVKAEANSSY